MLRSDKAKIIDTLGDVFRESGVVVVAHHKGLTVPEVTALRRQMRAAGARFRVTKNRLVRRSLEGTEYAVLEPLFKGPTAIAYSADPTVAPKALLEFAKKNDKIEIIGGGLSGVLLDPAAVKTLADLPPLDSLRAKLIGILTTPASRLLGVLQAPGAQIARVLSARAEQG